MYPLTEEEQKLFDFIKDPNNLLIASFKDMCKFMGFTAKGKRIFSLVYSLKAKGYLKKRGRNFQLTTEEDKKDF